MNDIEAFDLPLVETTIYNYIVVNGRISKKLFQKIVEPKLAELEIIKAENKKLREALEFYADEAHLEMKYSIGNEGNYPLGEYWNDTMCSENGRKAREALKEVDEV
jgi:hypothetical protein